MRMTHEDEEEGFGLPSLWLNPHLWREFLLNAPPGDGFAPLHDRDGRAYWLEEKRSEQRVSLRVHRRGGLVARAVVEWIEPDAVVLEDLFVASPYRRLGIGMDLLERAAALARLGGARRLTGRIIRKDLERNPRLLEWYRRYGFRVEPMQVATFDVGALPLSRAARRSASAYETVATISLVIAT